MLNTFDGRHAQHDPHDGRSGYTFQSDKVLFSSAVPGNSHFAVGAYVEEIMTGWPAFGRQEVQPMNLEHLLGHVLTVHARTRAKRH